MARTSQLLGQHNYTIPSVEFASSSKNNQLTDGGKAVANDDKVGIPSDQIQKSTKYMPNNESVTFRKLHVVIKNVVPNS